MRLHFRSLFVLYASCCIDLRRFAFTTGRQSCSNSPFSKCLVRSDPIFPGTRQARSSAEQSRIEVCRRDASRSSAGADHRAGGRSRRSRAGERSPAIFRLAALRNRNLQQCRWSSCCYPHCHIFIDSIAQTRGSHYPIQRNLFRH